METTTQNTSIQAQQQCIETQLKEAVAHYYVCNDRALRLTCYQNIHRLIRAGLEEYEMTPAMIESIINAVA